MSGATVASLRSWRRVLETGSLKALAETACGTGQPYGGTADGRVGLGNVKVDTSASGWPPSSPAGSLRRCPSADRGPRCPRPTVSSVHVRALFYLSLASIIWACPGLLPAALPTVQLPTQFSDFAYGTNLSPVWFRPFAHGTASNPVWVSGPRQWILMSLTVLACILHLASCEMF